MQIRETDKEEICINQNEKKIELVEEFLERYNMERDKL